MNDGGSVLGGNQTASGGTDALNSADLKISHDDTPATSTPETPTTPESTPNTPPAVTPDLAASPDSAAIAPVDSSTINLASSPAPFSNEGVLTSADNLEITNENIDEQINEALDSLSVAHDDGKSDANATTTDTNEEEHVPILPPSSGPAHIFGQEISGITDEDLSSPGTAQAIPTTVFPSVDAAAANPEATGDAAQAIAEALNPGQAAAPVATPEQPAAPNQTADPNQPANPNQAYTQYGYADPNQAYAQPVQPAAPAVPYEQQFMEQLHTDPKAAKPRKDTGDILINSEIPVQKTRMRLIIGIVIAVLVLAVLGVVAYFSIFGNSSTPKSRTETSRSLDAYGNALTNWERDSLESTTALKNLYSTFYEQAKTDPAYVEILNTLEAYSKDLEVAEYFANPKELTSEDILNMYIQKGYDATANKISQTYSPTEDTPEAVQPYIEIVSNFYNTLINQYSIYEEYGCFSEGDLDMQCVFEVEEIEPDLATENEAAYSEYLSATNEKQNIYTQIANSYDKIKQMVGNNEN